MDGIEHQLFGYIDGSEACSAARWAEDARAAIAEAHQRDSLPILVGGTGLYVRILLDGIAPIPPIEPEVRQDIRKMETLEAYHALQDEDPVAAERLHAADTTRIQRALEVVRSTGKPLDHWQRHKVGGIGEQIKLHPLVMLPPREWLYQRCDQRLHEMVARGRKWSGFWPVTCQPICRSCGRSGWRNSATGCRAILTGKPPLNARKSPRDNMPSANIRGSGTRARRTGCASTRH